MDVELEFIQIDLNERGSRLNHHQPLDPTSPQAFQPQENQKTFTVLTMNIIS